MLQHMQIHCMKQTENMKT